MTSQEVAIQRVLKAIEAVKSGGMVVMVDDEDRENEGDLVFAAAHVCPEKINFMTKEARGLICLSLDQAAVDRLKLPMMEDSTKRMSGKTTAFTVSIEARHGVTTGISAADRAQTIKVASNPATGPDDIVVPGHVFPLKARPGGVLERAGHTEGSVDLARLAGLNAAAVICEIMNEDGSMARLPDIERFSARHGIPVVTIADLITFRLLRESLVEEVARAPVATSHGTFQGVLFKGQIEDQLHLALVKGEPTADRTVDVRVHRQRPLVDVFSDSRTGGRRRIEYGLEMLRDADAAVFLYLNHTQTPESYALEFEALTGTGSADSNAKAAKPWVETDPRTLGVGAQILRQLGVHKMRVHMSNPVQLKGLSGYDLEVVDQVPITPLA